MLLLRADYSDKLPCKYSIFASFNYDPRYVELIKSLSTRCWNPDSREWEIDYTHYTELVTKLNTSGIPYNGEEFVQSLLRLKEKIEQSENISKTEPILTVSDLAKMEFKTRPYEYQLEGIAYGLANNKFLLADEQGLGKSLQTLNIATLRRGGRHCLVIVGYDTLQFNWVAEVEKHTNEKGYVLGQRTVSRGPSRGQLRKGTMKQRIEDLENIDNIDEFFIITSVATLRHCEKTEYIDKNGKKKHNKQYVVAEMIEKLCQNGTIGRVVFDEAQVVKSIDTDQTKALLKVKSCPYKIIATGTPIMNKHLDLYPLMFWLDKEYGNFYSFRNKYCIMGGFNNKEVKGNKNGQELNQRLSKFMLRRKKEDVLDLPEKIIIDEYLDMELKQSVLYDKVKKIAQSEMMAQKGNKVALMALLLNLRKVTCHPNWIDDSYTDSVKFERIHQLMHEITENEKKAIIFSNWSTPILKLKEELGRYNPAMIIGDTQDRISEVTKFQTDDSCKVILGTIGAMGTGITLTAASNVIFLDEPWNRALKDQCIDRAHRIGTRSNVNVYTLICRGTVDEGVHGTVRKKGMIADEVIDGFTSEELLAILST